MPTDAGSFLTEVRDKTEEYQDNRSDHAVDVEGGHDDNATGYYDNATGYYGNEEHIPHNLSVLYEDLENENLETILYHGSKVIDETGSEYDTDLEDAPSDRIEYDSSGIDHYLKICKDMKMRPVSHFMRQTKNTSLSLKYQSLGCEKTVAITQALASNTFVEVLDLSDNDIGCEGVVSVADMLTENYFITEINLEDNKVGVRGTATLCEVLAEHSYVKHLNLSGNALKDDSAQFLAEMLKQNYTLTTLIINHNQFSCVGGKAIAGAMVGNDSLTELDVSWNKMRAKGCEAFGKMLAVNTGLISLNISFNGLDSLGSVAFVKAIKTNQQLVNLNLINTRFVGSQCKELAKSLAANTTLKILKLGNNPLKEADLDLLLNGLPAASLFILGLEDIPMSRSLYGRMCVFEKEHELVVHYGNSGGNQCARPMTSSALVLDEFITTNTSKLAPILLAKDKDRTGCVTVEDFKECLKEAGLRLHQNELNRLVDKLKIADNAVPCKDLLSGKVPVMLERFRSSS